MILTGNEIIKQYQNGSIILDPFNVDYITTNSYDLRLGNTLLKYTNMVLDPKVDNSYELISIPKEGYKMKSGEFLLGHTEEILGSTKYVPLIHNKSSIARLGLFVHITADLIDIGSIGNSTLQLYATMPIRLYSGMKIAQVSFRVPQGNIKLYEGKYQHSRGPQSSKTYKDFIQ